MKRVILMRHAKSDWSAGAGSDHERPLNKRGRNASDALGHWLQDQGIMPDQVLCSSAERTGETYLRLGLPSDIATDFTRKLYLATHNDILKALQGASGDVVLILGHNPGMSIVASELLSERPDHPKFDQFPSGATLVADFDIDDWAQADWGKADARHFLVPREL